ncbi:MAG: HTH domain-containing protein [Saprospiraceae bacterium]|nr:HTH domain-containing protein [Saprospiraceae bacterium]
MKIKDRILILLEEKGDLSVKEMTDLLEVSKQAIHIAINQLLEEETIIKFGKVPKSIYRLQSQKTSSKEKTPEISAQNRDYLDKHFLAITEVGEMMVGVEGFTHWCHQRKLPLEKTLSEYLLTKEKYNVYYDKYGLINGKEKLMNTKGYDQIHLDSLYYLDFYAIERFGKTRLGTLLHYAKQGQNKPLMKILVNELKPKLERLLSIHSFDAVAYVPPTIKREVQIMKYMETHLKINLPKINITKISGIIPVPQKSLSKIEERITNAENTFAVSETVKYQHVLLIDDAVGSGSTLNQIAGKLKKKGIAQLITGLAIVGSFKGFDVVTDV